MKSLCFVEQRMNRKGISNLSTLVSVSLVGEMPYRGVFFGRGEREEMYDSSLLFEGDNCEAILLLALDAHRHYLAELLVFVEESIAQTRV